MGGCARCGRCCTNFGVCVTPADILRLSRATGLKPSEICMAIDEPPERERGEPAILIDGKPSLLVLRWKGNAGRRCFFYSENGCMAYESRPMLCRTYPFRLKAGSLKDMASRACPRLWLPADKGRYLSDLAQYEEDVRGYRAIAKDWNRARGGSLEKFLSFALGRDAKSQGGQKQEGKRPPDARKKLP